jgi:hypothetical protein
VAIGHQGEVIAVYEARDGQLRAVKVLNAE